MKPILLPIAAVLQPTGGRDGSTNSVGGPFAPLLSKSSVLPCCTPSPSPFGIHALSQTRHHSYTAPAGSMHALADGRALDVVVEKRRRRNHGGLHIFRAVLRVPRTLQSNTGLRRPRRHQPGDWLMRDRVFSLEKDP